MARKIKPQSPLQEDVCIQEFLDATSMIKFLMD